MVPWRAWYDFQCKPRGSIMPDVMAVLPQLVRPCPAGRELGDLLVPLLLRNNLGEVVSEKVPVDVRHVFETRPRLRDEPRRVDEHSADHFVFVKIERVRSLNVGGEVSLARRSPRTFRLRSTARTISVSNSRRAR